MQAKVFTLFALGATLMVACDDPVDQGTMGRRNGAGANGEAAGATGARPSGAGATGPVCPSDLVAPTSIATDVDASDLHIAGGAVYFRSGTKFVRVGLDGGARTELYTSKDLVRTFTDGKTLVAVETPDQGNAVLRVGAVGAKPDERAQVGTDLQATGTNLFGSDETSIFAVGETDGGDNIYKVARTDAGGIETVAETTGVVSAPQIVGGVVWFVRDSTEIYKVPVAGGEPTLVTSVPGGCALAVGATHLYCSTNGALEQRDLAGANPTKLFDAQSSRLAVGFGTGVASGDTVVMRSSGNGAFKSVLRSVDAAGEHVIACGRETIGAMAFDGVSVAWVEAGKGVFVAKTSGR